MKVKRLVIMFIIAATVQITSAQEKIISGTVSDVSGVLPGVSVIIEGTSKGVETDFDGKYAIKASPGDVLVFRYLGFKTTNTTVGTSNTINVTLEEGGEILDEVVVTAFGIKREKKEISYVVEKVSADKLLAVQPQSAASALAGKVAGLQINVQNNGVNPSTQILLRGMRSISQSNSALIVIDGSIATQEAFDQLNPNDIENISVLKGATAAALYGSRAGNGALIVNTKRGDLGEKITVGINTSYTIEEVSFMPDMQESYGTGWQGAYDPYENTNWGPAFDGLTRRIGPIFSDGSYQAIPYAPIKDNLKDFYDTGSSSQNTVYLSGSDEKNRFYLSLGQLDNTGVVPSDSYKRNTFRVNASRKIGDVKLSVNTSYTTDRTDIVGNTIGEQELPLYWHILNTAANIPLSTYKDWRNDLYSSPDGYYNAYYQNPYWAIDTNRNMDRSKLLNGNIALNWEVNSWLNLTGRLGVNNLSRQGKNYRAAQPYSEENHLITVGRPNPVTSFVEDYESQRTQYTTDFLAEGKFNINDKFTLKAILGATNFTSQFRESEYKANNLSIPDFYDLSNTTGQLQGGLSDGAFVNEKQKKTYGLFGDVTVGYDDILYLNVSGRNDWTSTLDKNNNSYFYPSVGLSFSFADLLEFDDLNYGKFTVSNSIVYNDVGPYDINETYSQQVGFPYSSTGLNGFVIAGTAVDASVGKEKIATLEFGLGLGLFNNRVTLDASYYTSTTTDLITTATTAPSAGSSAILTNIGSIDGDSYELSLGLTPFKALNNGDFNWNLNTNFTTTKQTVTEIQEGVDEINIGGTAVAGIYAVVGEAYPQIKATSYERDPQGRVVIDAATGNPKVGGLKSLGQTTPKYIVGLTNAFSYKGFTLTTTMDYRTGHVYYSQLADKMEFTGRSQESVSTNRQDFIFPNSVTNTGTADNPVYVANNNIQTTGGGQNFWTNTFNDIKENYVKDATSLKIREVSLRYELPDKYINNTGLSKVTLGLIARNLAVWLPKENRFSDPEFNNNPLNDKEINAIGIGGYRQSPPTRSFGLNVNLEF